MADNPNDLVFRLSRSDTPNDLVFGADESSGLDTVMTVAAKLSLIVSVRMFRSHPMTVAANLPAMAVHVSMKYVSGAERPLVNETKARWQDSLGLTAVTQQHFQDSLEFRSETQARFQDASRLGAETSSHFQDSLEYRTEVQARFQDALRADGSPTSIRLQDGLKAGVNLLGRFQDALRADGSPTSIRFQDGTRISHEYVSRFQAGLRLLNAWPSRTRSSLPLSHWFANQRFQDAIRPGPGVRVVVPPVKEPCYTPSNDLLFSEAWTEDINNLVFVCDTHGGTNPEEPGETVIIPIKGVYIVDNDVLLTRADNGLSIRAITVGLALDVSSWTWSFNATIPPYYFDDVQRSSPSTPVELFASINGHAVRVIVERVGKERTWESSVLRLTGRGVSALLSGPLAPIKSFAGYGNRNMAQLAEDVLTDNGVPIGWAVAWNVADWAVPAGVFSVQGVYADALNTLATAAGGYVQPHMTDRTVRILKKYPTLPWDWAAATPDFVLPSDVVTVEGIDWDTKPLYTRVFVSGMQGGVTVDATRAGTGGLMLAPGVTDALITHVDGGRARAEPILADVGDQALVRLRMPIFEASGLIVPGKLVKYVDEGVERIGLSRSLSVEAAQEESWQTIEVETHA